jgi:hypothetical protein
VTAAAAKEWTADRPHWMSEAAPSRDNGKSEPASGRDNGTSETSPEPPRPEPEAVPFTPAAQGDGTEASAAEEDNTRPIRRGWWQRRFTST